MEKDNFIFRCDIVDKLKDFSNEDFGIIIKSLAEYVRNGEIPQLQPTLMMAFNFIKIDIDKDLKKYQEKCEKNKLIALGKWKKGKKK